MHVDLIARLVLPAPPPAAYGLSLDADRFPALFSGFGPIPRLRAIRLHAPPAVGSTREVEDANGVVMLERITVLDPPQRHAYTLGGFVAPLSWLAREAHADWRFTAHDGGTDVVWHYRFELTSPLAWPLAFPILRVFMQGAMRRCLAAMAASLATHGGAD
jgi:hypothetical protein